MLGFYTRRLFILTKRAGEYIIMHVKIRKNRMVLAGKTRLKTARVL